MSKSKPRKRHSLRRMVRPFVPTWHHQSGYPKQPVRVEYWSGDDRFRASLHLHWNWMGRAHWLCVFMPEWPWQNTVSGGAAKTS